MTGIGEIIAYRQYIMVIRERIDPRPRPTARARLVQQETNGVTIGIKYRGSRGPKGAVSRIDAKRTRHRVALLFRRQKRKQGPHLKALQVLHIETIGSIVVLFIQDTIGLTKTVVGRQIHAILRL